MHLVIHIVWICLLYLIVLPIIHFRRPRCWGRCNIRNDLKILLHLVLTVCISEAHLNYSFFFLWHICNVWTNISGPVILTMQSDRYCQMQSNLDIPFLQRPRWNKSIYQQDKENKKECKRVISYKNGNTNVYNIVDTILLLNALFVVIIMHKHSF